MAWRRGLRESRTNQDKRKSRTDEEVPIGGRRPWGESLRVPVLVAGLLLMQPPSCCSAIGH
jgi:hypothetical protein